MFLTMRLPTPPSVLLCGCLIHLLIQPVAGFLVWSTRTPTTASPTFHQRQSRALSTTWSRRNAIMNENDGHGQVVEVTPREIMALLTTRYDESTGMNRRCRQQSLVANSTLATATAPPRTAAATTTTTRTTTVAAAKSWTKTRNYVYKTKRLPSLQQVTAVLSFLEDVFPDDRSLVRTVVQSSPRILKRNVANNLWPTADFLQDLYGPDLFREAVRRNPDLLLTAGVGHNAANDQVQDYLRNDLAMSAAALKKLQKNNPSLFQLDIDKIRSVVTCLDNVLTEGGYKTTKAKKVLSKMIATHPYLLNLSVETNLWPRLEFLRESCQLAPKELADLVKSSAGVLGLSVSDNLKPTLDYLSDLLSVQQQQAPNEYGEHMVGSNVDASHTSMLRKCVLSHPQILALSLKNIRNKVEYFNSLDGSSSTSTSPPSHLSLAGKIAARSPVVYSLSLQDNIIPTIEFLARVWGATPTDTAPSTDSNEPNDKSVSTTTTTTTTLESATLGRMLGEYPAVLTLSLEGNIRPTMEFFNQTGYTELDSDWRLIESSSSTQLTRRIRGRYISASLFNRLLPRWHFLLQRRTGRQGSSSLSSTSAAKKKEDSMLPPIHVLVTASDDEFCAVCGDGAATVQAYKAFRSESAPRLKFSSQFNTWLKTGRTIEL